MISPKTISTVEQLDKQIGDLLGESMPEDAFYRDLLRQSYRDYFDAIENIEGYGMLIEAESGRLFINPAMAIKSESHKQIIKVLRLLNINPRMLTVPNEMPTPANTFADELNINE